MADLITAPTAAFAVAYGHEAITAYVEPFLVRLSFTDHLTGQADEAELVLENREGLFIGSYFPIRGDEFDVSVGWKGGELDGLWRCGTFVIDEAQVQGPPDQVVIRGLSASVKAEGQTKRSRAYESCTLREIVTKAASAAGYTIVGDIPDITFNRVTQHQETDLGFLYRLAKLHGCILKVANGSIIVNRLNQLLDTRNGAAIYRQDVIRYNLRAKTAETYRAAVTRYWDPNARDQVRFLVPKGTVASTLVPPVPGPPKAGTRTILGTGFAPKMDVLRLLDRVENAAQAQARIDGMLLQATVGNIAGTIEVVGDPRIRAGMGVYLWPEEWGALGTWYIVTRARHTITRHQGYITELDLGHNPSPGAAPKKSKPGAPPKKIGKGAR